MRQNKGKIATRKRINSYSYKKFVGVLVSTGVIIAFLVLISQTFAQKTKEDVEATDFVLDVAALYLNVGEIDESIEILEKLRATFPEDYDIRLYLGIALCEKQDYESAFEEFQKIENALEMSKRKKDPRSLYKWVSWKREKFAFSLKNKGLLYFGRGITFLMTKADFKAAKNNFIWALKEE